MAGGQRKDPAPSETHRVSSRTAVHFGGGALGRGLVVPRLVGAGWSVTVVDRVEPLVDALNARGGYDLAVVDDDRETLIPIGIAGALHPSRDGEAVAKLLAGAALITTAVRRENLGKVVGQIALAWRRHGRAEGVAIVGCENVEHVDGLLKDAFGAAGVSAEDLEGVAIPATVVDRICASGWPQDLTVRTEAYTELAVQALPGAELLPGVDQVPDIDAVFDRKRYLVNTLADASAILGVAKGYATLSQAVRDPDIVGRIAPLVAALMRHLELRHGFSAESLEAYLKVSEGRLGNRGIPRRLDTVARDIWRKMQPGERFMAPLIDLQRRGALDEASIGVLAELAMAGARIDDATVTQTAVAARFREIGQSVNGDVAGVYAAVAGAIGG
jgi:mannitol-1-phosphate 5-dehydrogenase